MLFKPCDECKKVNKLTTVNACLSSFFGTNTCCTKRVCVDGRKIKLKCNHPYRIHPHRLQNKSISLRCNICNKNTTYNPLWW